MKINISSKMKKTDLLESVKSEFEKVQKSNLDKQVFNKSQVEKDIAIILSEEHEEDEMEM